MVQVAPEEEGQTQVQELQAAEEEGLEQSKPWLSQVLKVSTTLSECGEHSRPVSPTVMMQLIRPSQVQQQSLLAEVRVVNPLPTAGQAVSEVQQLEVIQTPQAQPVMQRQEEQEVKAVTQALEP